MRHRSGRTPDWFLPFRGPAHRFRGWSRAGEQVAAFRTARDQEAPIHVPARFGRVADSPREIGASKERDPGIANDRLGPEHIVQAGLRSRADTIKDVRRRVPARESEMRTAPGKPVVRAGGIHGRAGRRGCREGDEGRHA